MLKKFAQSKLSKPLIPSYIKTFHINTEEMQEDVRSFNSLHELFIRKLKSGARPFPLNQTAWSALWTESSKKWAPSRATSNLPSNKSSIP